MTRVAQRSVTAIKVSIVAKIQDSKYHKNQPFLQVAAKLWLEMIIPSPGAFRPTVIDKGQSIGPRLCDHTRTFDVRARSNSRRTSPGEGIDYPCKFLQNKETNEDKIHLLIYINASLTPTTNTPVKEKKTHGLGEIHYCVFN